MVVVRYPHSSRVIRLNLLVVKSLGSKGADDWLKLCLYGGSSTTPRLYLTIGTIYPSTIYCL